DGLADVVVGAPFNDAVATDSGRTYVVFGRTGSEAVTVDQLLAGQGGLVITGTEERSEFGFSVGSAGDFNGDGLADLVITAHIADTPSGQDSGRVYVVFGRTGAEAIDLDQIVLGNGGFVLDGQSA